MRLSLIALIIEVRFTTSRRSLGKAEHQAFHGLSTTQFDTGKMFPASSRLELMPVDRLNEVGHEVGSVG